MQIHDLPDGTIGATEYTPIDNGSTNRKTTLSAIGTYIINTVTASLGGVTRTIKAAIDAAWTKLGSGSISNVGADVSAAIGNTSLGTTATSLSGAIAEHEGDITALGQLTTQSLALVSGAWTSSSTVGISCVKRGNTVTFSFNISGKPAYSDAANHPMITSLPTGWRPLGSIYLIRQTQSGKRYLLVIGSDGTISFNFISQAMDTEWFRESLTWVVA